jgi:hypothetical protein
MSEQPQMSRQKCFACGVAVTWASVKVQYGRAIKRGFSQDQAKEACPRCYRCMTKYLRNMEKVLADRATE